MHTRKGRCDPNKQLLSGIQSLALLQTVIFFGLFVLSTSPRLQQLSLFWRQPQVCLMRVNAVSITKIALTICKQAVANLLSLALTHIMITPAGMIVWTLLLQKHCRINQVIIHKLSKAISQPPSNAMHMRRHSSSNSKCTGSSGKGDAADTMCVMLQAQGYAHHHPQELMPPHGVGP